MLKDVVRVEALEPYRLLLEFEDGIAGEIDIARLVRFDGVFAPLRDPAIFRAVRVEPNAGTVVWIRLLCLNVRLPTREYRFPETQPIFA